jgi:DNA-binding transcriptional MerR regulator
MPNPVVSLPALVLLLAAASSAASPPKTPPAPAPGAKGPAIAGQPALRDRVLAIVDEDPILGSDVERLIALGLAKSDPGESDHDFRYRVLGQLIDQRLRFHEIDRFGFEPPPPDLIDKQVKEIHDSFKSEADFQQRLKEVGLPLAGLRQLVSRQLMVLTYVDERLGPRVFVSSEDIDTYYRDVLTPELQKRGQAQPSKLDEVRQQIRTVLKEQRLNKEIDTWTDDLRRKADILNYFNDQGKALPPVVKTIETKKKPPRH